MAQFELEPLPLKMVLEQVHSLIAKGHDPMQYLNMFLFSDSGARFRKA